MPFYLNPIASKLISLALLGIINFYNFLKSIYKKQTKAQKIRFNAVLALTGISVVETIISFSIPHIYPFCWVTALSRVLLMVMQVRQLRNTFDRFLYVLRDSA